ncbi:MAG: permease-like cell division protein FtsX [Bacteroidales bacterium]|nr:permease-like cell division protein FtsX [Bacteroidales bacterium]
MKRRMTGAYVSSVVSISLVLMLVGVASALIVNAKRVSDYFKESVQVSLLLSPSVSDDAATVLASSIEKEAFVKSATVVGKAQGEKELKDMLGEDFLSVFESAPVPVSVDLGLKADYVSADSLAKIIPLLEAIPEVDEVESRQSLVEALNKNLSGISLVLGIFILLMLFISFILIGNTVRLGLHARRFTIHTMRLVGATRAFIRKPFIRSAIVQGVVSALLAIAVLAGVALFIRRSFPQLFSIFSPELLCAVGVFILLFGVFICVVATWSVVNRLSYAGEDDLYY